MVLLAELILRHSRRHMPTRRVAVGSAYLPLAGAAAPGAFLIGAVVHEFATGFDDETRDDLLDLTRAAAGGLDVPRIALRHRLQRDTHGLDRSRHRVEQELDRIVVELDTHGAALPQVLGTILSVAILPLSVRAPGLLAVRQALLGRNPLALRGDVVVRRLIDGVPYEVPWAPDAAWKVGRPAAESAWAGVPAERRWAMEVLGIGARVSFERGEVNRRYRRLLRDAHPDTGAVETGARDTGAAERIAELSEARELLLDLLVAAEPATVGAPADASAASGDQG